VIQFFTYKQRENEIVNAQLCLADEISQSVRAPQAARAMDQPSHKSRLRVGGSVASAHATNGSCDGWLD